MSGRSPAKIVEAARSDGRDNLLETEGLELLRAIGIAVPECVFVRDAAQLGEGDLRALPGFEVVVKVVSPEVLHKSDEGGVVFAAKEVNSVKQTIQSMEEAFDGRDVRGYLLVECVEYDPSLGGELLMSARWTDDFGPVVTYGAGGVYTEFLAENFRASRDVAIASAEDLSPASAEALIRGVAVTKLLTGELRGQDERIAMHQIIETLLKFGALARETMPDVLSEFEVNPFVISEGRLVPLDVLARCALATAAKPASRPVRKLKNLFEPKSIAFVGVSERMNPGRVSLINTLRAGFERERVYVVKPGSDTIEGCACYPDLESLPEKVDKLVLAVAAGQVPEMLAVILEKQLAENVVLIPGGIGETEGSTAIVEKLHHALAKARDSDWRGPLLVGANSMGVRSVPGRYDTTFLPERKLPMPEAPLAPIAYISQSGAFYGAKGGKVGLAPRYAISVGNQTDLTIGDYLAYLKDDPKLEIFAIYVEGFQPLDGARFLSAAREISKRGKTIVLYRAGRTAEGQSASASHTASIAGDYAVTRQLAESAGVIVCDTTDDFEDMVKLFAFLGSKTVNGSRLGAISNAGFECVSISDHLTDLRLTEFTEPTKTGLRALLKEARLDEVIDVRNPVDITPIMPDAPFEKAVRLVLEDDNVDVALVACVPLTGALQTLAPGDSHAEDIYAENSVAMRLVRLKDQVDKPWVVAVDGGPLYDPMARLLEEHGIPTFRTADRALRLLTRFCGAKIGR